MAVQWAVSFPRPLPVWYAFQMVQLATRPILRGQGFPALTRQRELLILCARIGFNP
jgi:hypothetical protein